MEISGTYGLCAREFESNYLFSQILLFLDNLVRFPASARSFEKTFSQEWNMVSMQSRLKVKQQKHNMCGNIL